MDPEKVAADIASLIKGAEGYDKALDRLERALELLEKEVKDLKDSRLAVEKQYEGMFAELQHRLNEVQEMRELYKTLAAKTKDREKKIYEDIGAIKDKLHSHETQCEQHKEKTKEKSAWYIIKNETGLALRIVWTFFGLFLLGAIIGWDRLEKWLIKLLG